ncbi:hypothetical protein TNCV_385541, partial [Trichonephila clavipes]
GEWAAHQSCWTQSSPKLDVRRHAEYTGISMGKLLRHFERSTKLGVFSMQHMASQTDTETIRKRLNLQACCCFKERHNRRYNIHKTRGGDEVKLHLSLTKLSLDYESHKLIK